MSAMGAYMLLGFIGLLVSGFFLSQAYSILSTLYFGMAAVMARLQAGGAASGIQETRETAAALGRYGASRIPLR